MSLSSASVWCGALRPQIEAMRLSARTIGPAVNDICQLSPFGDLSAEDLASWRSWVSRAGLGGSPFHQPEFIFEVAEAFGSCAAITIRSAASLKAIIPVAVEGRNFAPVPMCDYQTVAWLDGEPFDPRRVLRKLGFATWKYTSASVDSALGSFSTYHALRPSPRVRTDGAWPEYLEHLRRSPQRLTHILQGLRRLERDVGPVRLEYDCEPCGRIDRMLSLKSERLGVPVFSTAVLQTLTRLQAVRRESVQGVFSVLTAGETDIAYAYTLRSGDEEFYWFHGFEAQFAHASPGHLLTYLMIERFCSLGRRSLDLGPGGEAWKTLFANVYPQVVTGRIDANPLRAHAIRLVQAGLQGARGH